jgi:hypothetical protein
LHRKLEISPRKSKEEVTGMHADGSSCNNSASSVTGCGLDGVQFPPDVGIVPFSTTNGRVKNKRSVNMFYFYTGELCQSALPIRLSNSLAFSRFMYILDNNIIFKHPVTLRFHL